VLSLTDARRLVKLLDRAKRAAGEHSVEQAWRADAMHAVGERLVEMYHRNQHENAIELIHDLAAAADDLAGRITAEEHRRLPRRHKVA
jgi:hypothetical protein